MANSSAWTGFDDNVTVVGLADLIKANGMWQGRYEIYLGGKLIYAREANGMFDNKEAAELEARFEGQTFFEEEADPKYRRRTPGSRQFDQG